MQWWQRFQVVYPLETFFVFVTFNTLPMKKQPRDIYSIIGEMCQYWSISYQHELKTIRTFKKMCTNLKSTELSQITPAQLIALHTTLRKGSTGCDESVKRQYAYVSRLFKYAYTKGYLKRNVCDLVKLPQCKRSKPKSLTQEELEQIEECLPRSLQMKRVKDCFLFQCYTGLAFADFATFSRDKLHTIQGKQYIIGNRCKSGEEYIIPVTAKSRLVMEKYNYNFGCNCIQFYNRKLKELQKLTDVEKTLTSHLARRTFGQLMLDDGIPLETVSRMLGHSSTGMTERAYARVGIKRIVMDMERLAA